ncbi:MAG: tetratricopeptide repeat protein, partial [Bacteroides sp.]
EERSVTFTNFMKQELDFWRDSLHVSNNVTLDDDGTMTLRAGDDGLSDLSSKLVVKPVAEDWDRLVQMIDSSSINGKEGILKIIAAPRYSHDSREYAIRKQFPAGYHYMREHFYPRLRAVNIKFELKRRGMLEETVTTTELDSVYAEGVRLLKARDYENAIEVLKPYDDLNTALAYMSLGYNEAALRICSAAKPTENILYMKAILHARIGDEGHAVELLKQAVEINPKLRFRGNLDPEISRLIKRYRLFKDDEF